MTKSVDFIGSLGCYMIRVTKKKLTRKQLTTHYLPTLFFSAFIFSVCGGT